MRKYMVLTAVLIVILLLFAMPALAVENFNAVREENGDVTLTWTGGEPGEKLTIQRMEHAQWKDLVNGIPQTDGRYVDKNPPAEETKYRLRWGLTGGLGPVTAPPFGSPGGSQGGTGNAQVVDRGGLFERAIAEVVDSLCGIFQGVIGAVAHFQPISELIFPSKGSPSTLERPHPFDDQWPLLDRMYLTFAITTLPLCLVAVFLTAIKLIRAGAMGGSQDRADAYDGIWRWFFAIVIIASAPLLVRCLLQLDNALTEAFRGATSSLGGVSYDVMNSNNAVTTIRTGSVLGTALVKFYLVVMEFWLNMIFFVRDWVLRIFYIFTPVMAWMWAINKRVNAAAVWMGEILTNTLMHSAYALAFCVIVTFMGVGSIPWPEKVIGVTSLIALGGVLRNTLQDIWTRLSGVDEEGVAGKTLGALGFGGILGVAKLGAVSVPGAAPSGGIQPIGGSPAGGINLQGSSVQGGAMPGSQQILGGTIPGGITSQGGPPTPGTMPPIASTVSAPGGPVPQVGGISPGGILLPAGSSVLKKQAPQPAERLSGALNTGKITQGVFQMGAGVLSAPFSVMPGGESVRRFIVGAAGAAGKTVGMTYDVARQAYAQSRESSSDKMEALKKTPAAIGETLRQMTGDKSAMKAGLKVAGVATLDAMMPKMGSYAVKKVSLDGYRHRP